MGGQAGKSERGASVCVFVSMRSPKITLNGQTKTSLRTGANNAKPLRTYMRTEPCLPNKHICGPYGGQMPHVFKQDSIAISNQNVCPVNDLYHSNLIG